MYRRKNKLQELSCIIGIAPGDDLKKIEGMDGKTVERIFGNVHQRANHFVLRGVSAATLTRV